MGESAGAIRSGQSFGRRHKKSLFARERRGIEKPLLGKATEYGQGSRGSDSELTTFGL